jgi:hypothetical protein
VSGQFLQCRSGCEIPTGAPQNRHRGPVGSITSRHASQMLRGAFSGSNRLHTEQSSGATRFQNERSQEMRDIATCPFESSEPMEVPGDLHYRNT